MRYDPVNNSASPEELAQALITRHDDVLLVLAHGLSVKNCVPPKVIDSIRARSSSSPPAMLSKTRRSFKYEPENRNAARLNSTSSLATVVFPSYIGWIKYWMADMPLIRTSNSSKNSKRFF